RHFKHSLSSPSPAVAQLHLVKPEQLSPAIADLASEHAPHATTPKDDHGQPIGLFKANDAEEGWFWREMIGVVSCLDLHNGGDIPNTIAVRFRTIRRADGTRAHCPDRVRISRTSSNSGK